MASIRSRLENFGVADRAAGVRDRLYVALPAMIVFTVLGAFASSEAFWVQWWFYVGLGVFFSGVFLEPFFGTARACLANSLAAIGAFFSADRSRLEPLWTIFLLLALVLLVAAILAAVLPGSGRAKSMLNRVSTWGTSSLFGAVALLLESTSAVATGDPNPVLLAVGTVSLVVGVRLRLSYFRSRDVLFLSPVVVDSIGPNMLLLEGVAASLDPGTEVVVQPSGIVGTFLGRLPGPFGPRALVAVGAEWHSVAPRLPSHVSLEKTSETERVLGLVGAGSDTSQVRFAMAAGSRIGDPATVRVGDDDVLYQVASQGLVDYRWDDSRAVIAEATALQVGQVDGGRLRLVQRVPDPFVELRSAGHVVGAGLPAGHVRLGLLKGTDFPIGLALDASVRGHTAVLGMSGMGKTVVAQRVCHAVATANQVVALDVTGEYRKNLGFSTWVKDDFLTVGAQVYEPVGPNSTPAIRARDFVLKALETGNAEYVAGTPRSRMVCFEEAHGFVPEWNFASRGDADASATTASYVMQARKYALSFLVVSQRTAVVSKSVLSQCETYIVLRTIDDTSLSYFETIMGPAARQLLPGLARHEALCFGPGLNTDGPVVVSLEPPASSSVAASMPLSTSASSSPALGATSPAQPSTPSIVDLDTPF